MEEGAQKNSHRNKMPRDNFFVIANIVEKKFFEINLFFPFKRRKSFFYFVILKRGIFAL